MQYYWQPGTRINNDKYIVEQILGSGGFGITYKVRESRTNKQFAIKTLNYQCQQLPDFEQLQQKFINETIVLASCRHPNVVRVFPQMFQESGLWCMVMDYVEGEDLDSYLKKRGCFSEQEAIDIITNVGNALSHVHQQGFLHRDIKPHNILLRSSDLSPILIDFGLAKEYSIDTIRSMTSLWTDCYAPIEQYENRGNFGAWTDVYALAATLYKMVTDIEPIPSRYRVHAQLQTPQKHNPNISDRLNTAILKGMEFEPHNRPNSVEEWLNFFQCRRKRKSKLQLSFKSNITGININNINENATETFLYNNRKKVLSPQKHFVETLDSATVINMINVPAGTFMMGVSSLRKKYIAEYPQHQVKLKSFYISQHPITQAQYEAVMGKNPSNYQGFAFNFEKKKIAFNKERYRNFPVETIKWNDAIEFCKILSLNTGKIYQLPSEAQWEYACRAGTQTQYYFGDDKSQLKNYAWYGNWQFWLNALLGGKSGLSYPIGRKLPNQWNLYDMHGQVWEWCQDDWHNSYRCAPTDGSSWLSNNSNYKVIRGGSFLNRATTCRSSCRKQMNHKACRHNLGFRIVCI